MRTGDRWFEKRKQFDALPDGYTIRRDRVLTSSKTRRRMTDAGNAALYEIASVSPLWTEWGDGHATSMWSGACERRGYIEVAEPAKPSQGRLLFRATASGVRLANTWRKERGEKSLPLPLPVDPLTEIRNEAVENVDRDEGCTMEFNASPDAHRERYGLEEERLIEERVGGARGDEWPENLDTWDLHEAILREHDRDRLAMLNAELQARLDAGLVGSERV